MQYCDKCHVTIFGDWDRCPLCQAPLSGTPCPEEDVFPRLRTKRRITRLLMKLMLFTTVAAAIIALAVNFMLPGRAGWAWFVILGLASAWLLLAIALRVRRSIPKTILQLVMIGSVLALLWDWFTGARGWSVSYVLPILWTAAMAALLVLPRVLNLQLSDYMLYLVIDILFGILPALFYQLGWLHASAIPSLVCVATSGVSLAAVLIFQGRGLWAELTRRMHL